MRPSACEVDVKRAKCMNVVSGKLQTANANFILHFVVRDQRGTKGNLLLVERVLLSPGSKNYPNFG